MITALWVVACIPKRTPSPGASSASTAKAATPISGGHRVAHEGSLRAFGSFRRGLNLGNALDAPREGEWGVVLEERHVELIAQAGFDHVRLPVRFNGHALANPPYTIEPQFFERVDWAIARAQQHGLAVILDLHHYTELMEAPAEHAARFVGLWEQIAKRYQDQPERVAFELLNEPHKNLNPVEWNELLARTIQAIRRSNPERWLVVDSYFWSAPEYLKALELPASDRKLVASFHMYQPILFTHQGAHWMDPEYSTTGVVFPGPPKAPIRPTEAAQSVGWVRSWFDSYNTTPQASNPSSEAVVLRSFEIAENFGKEFDRPVYLGEFGAIDRADVQSRVNYVQLIRQEAERRGMAWSYWDDGGSYRVLDVKTGSWVTPLREALLK